MKITREKKIGVLASVVIALGSLSFDVAADITEVECLAQNIYYEARGEGKLGMAAVGHVTMNRVRNPNFPNTVCDVVYQKKQYRTMAVCQFSWVCMDRKPSIKPDLYQKAMEVAEKVYVNEVKDPTKGATHFHNTSIEASWATTKRAVARIGNHIFYKR